MYSGGITISEAQRDFLKEISNIGAGNGASALAALTNTKIIMEVPQVSVLPFDEIMDAVGGSEQLVAGIFLRVEGAAPCNILFIFSVADAYKVVDLMLRRPEGTTQEIDPVTKSTLEEMGNIVSGSFLAALSSFSKLRFYPSVPGLALDMAGALLNTVLLPYGAVSDQAVVIETTFSQADKTLNGHFFLLPDPGSMEIILEALGNPL